MNLPNRLTVLRVCMVPVFVVFMLWNGLGSSAKYVAAVIFILASMTDWLDGYLARKNNLVTDFGKFMDPIADKLLVCSAMICLVEKGALPAWIVIIIIGREFIISGFRLVASDKGVVIAASSASVKQGGRSRISAHSETQCPRGPREKVTAFSWRCPPISKVLDPDFTSIRRRL